MIAWRWLCTTLWKQDDHLWLILQDLETSSQGPGVCDSCKIVDIYQHMDNLAPSSATTDEKNKKDKKNKHGNGQQGGRGWRSINWERREHGFDGRGQGSDRGGRVAAVKEAEGTTPTTTMEEEVLTASMEAEEATESIMDTRIISTRGINNIFCHISSNQCLQQCLYLIPRPELERSSRTPTWTAMPSRWVEAPTVTNGATKGNSGRDQPNLVQRTSSWWMPVHWAI